MNIISQKLLSWWPVIILALVVFLIGFTNYVPNTFFTGWDNIHPEFNFSLNIKRSIFSAWQEYQSLGLPAGTGYASDLPRQLLLGLLSFIFPVSFLRYFYHLLALFLGALGVYVLIKDKKAALVGGIFYIFNLATLQMFFDPFEPVSHHFAVLPWIFYATLRYVKKKDQKSLLYLILIAVFSIPQAYVTTYFLVTMILMTIFFVFIFFQLKQWRQILICFLVFLAVNAFWLLPNMYYLLFKTSTTTDSQINQMSTQDNFLHNKKYGNLSNTLLLKGFWFDNVENSPNATTNYQLKDWVPYMDDPLVYSIGYILFGICLIGIILAVWRREKNILVFLPVFIFSFVILSNDTPILSQIGLIFYKIPLFAQIFRFPFTKFSIATAFCLSIFYATSFALLTAQERFKKYTILLLVIFVALPILLLIPIFRGDFFDKRNRLEIPKSYFQTFDFFKNQDPNTRIANFPQFSYWGWTYYKWGYRGSGFLWYGIEQPILDRTFDVWSRHSENYYYEISYAIYSDNQKLFENVLEKYQINWLLVDDAVTSFASQKQLYNDNLRQIISGSSKIKLVENFDNIKIYKVDLRRKPTKFVFIAENSPAVSPYNWNNNDRVFYDYGDYISLEDNQIFYPFRSLFSGKKQDMLEFKVSDQTDYFLFKANVPKGFDNVITPPLLGKEISEIDSNDFSIKLKEPTVSFNGKVLDVKVPKISGLYSFENNKEILGYKSSPCNAYNKDTYNYQPIKEQNNNILRLTSINSSNCIIIGVPQLTHQLGYLITIKNRHLQGKSLLFGVTNHNTDRLDLETYFPKTDQLSDSYFILPPMEQYGIGYTLNFDNISYGRVETVNDLGPITIHPIPYHFLTALKITKGNSLLTSQNSNTSIEDVYHPNPSFYQIRLKAQSSLKKTTLVLSQSFDAGWKAYQIKGWMPWEIKDHILVNNWENGWEIKDDGDIILVYLPQYLEYLGFFILILLFLSITYNLSKAKITG